MKASLGGVDGALRELPGVLDGGERVEALAVGSIHGSQGLVVLTSGRLIFLGHAWGVVQLVEFPYVGLTGVNWAPGRVNGRLTLHQRHRSDEIKGILKNDGEVLYSGLRDRAPAVPAFQQPSASHTTPPRQPATPAGAVAGAAGGGGLFGRRRKQAEAEVARLAETLSNMQARLAGVQADNDYVRQELARVMGMDGAQLAGEVERLQQVRRELQEQTAQADDLLDAKIESAAALAAAATEEARAQCEALRREKATAERQLQHARSAIVATEELAMLQEAGIYEFRHPLEDAVAYKAELQTLKDQYKVMAKNGTAVYGATDWQVNGSVAQGRKMVRDFSKLMLRAYNAEADAAVRGMRPHRLASLVERLTKSRETIARLGATMHIQVSDSYHRLRVRELELTADYLMKQEQEKEHRRELREQQREEEKLQREIARERERLEKERRHFTAALERLRGSGSPDSDAVAELEAKLQDVDAAVAAVDYREANIRAGYVYVISNIGAFGEEMVKIGMTRRLEPMDRVIELGDASVPFRFDVHALIFSEDAVSLERALHQAFEDRRVNRVNLRREFFRVRPVEVREALARHAGQHLLEFHEEADAPEWRASRVG